MAFFVADVVFDVEEEEAAGAEDAEGFGPGAVVEAAVGAAPLEGAAVVGVEGGAVLVGVGVAAAGVGGGEVVGHAVAVGGAGDGGVGEGEVEGVADTGVRVPGGPAGLELVGVDGGQGEDHGAETVSSPSGKSVVC